MVLASEERSDREKKIKSEKKKALNRNIVSARRSRDPLCTFFQILYKRKFLPWSIFKGVWKI